MRTTISKQFRWEMGHRLPFHEGLCKNIHGHSYEAHVILTGEPDANGMVMDYYDMKLLIQDKLDELDHCFLCDADSTRERSDNCREHRTHVADARRVEASSRTSHRQRALARV